MSFDIADCLFIGVDIQPLYAGSKNSAALRRIESLRADIAASNAPSWQVYMREPEARTIHPQKLKRERARIAHNHTLIFAPAPNELVFGKSDQHANNVKFERTLNDLRPAAIFLYGFWLDVCVDATAKHAQELMENIGLKPEIAIIADCGETYFGQGLDGCLFQTVIKDELCFPAIVCSKPQPFHRPHPRGQLPALATFN